jgi:hypothetical protein
MFSVKDQLAGKLGHNAFSLLLDQLNAAAAEKPKRRRRRRRKQVTA